MKKIMIASLCLSLVFLGCKGESEKELFLFPEIVLKLESDTVESSKSIRGIIHLSDTSFLKYNTVEGKSYRVKPIMKVNETTVPVDENSEAIFEIQTEYTDTISSKYQEHGMECSIEFPHPSPMHGSVKLTTVYHYWVVKP